VASGLVQGSDGKVPERGHGSWPGSGADGGFVLLIKGVPELLQGVGPAQMARSRESSR
jgi:hypothetical protein